MNSPFKLLEPFTEKDRESFFGRNAEIDEQYDLVRRSRLMIVHGLSGTGKTSLLRCGLYNEFDGPDWYPLFVRTGTNINEAINQTLATALKSKEVSEDNVENIVKLYERTYRPPYLILDQFEEFFILPGNTEKVRLKFMNDIRRLLDTGIEVRVIFVLREEFLGEFYPYEAIIPELFDVRFRVERMTNAKVREVVRDSFEQFNIVLEEPLQKNLDTIVENISSEGLIDLPYLQIYLDMLYETAVGNGSVEIRKDGDRHPRVTIRPSHIEEIGDIRNVLRNFLEGRMDIYVRLYRDKPEIPTDLAQRILISMVTEHGTKVPTRVDIVADPENPGDEIIIPEFKLEDKIYIGNIDQRVITGTIKKLVEQQIIRRRPDSIEIAHDSLAAIIAGWKTDEEQHLRVLYRRIQTAFIEYEDSNGSTLMSDSLLDAIEMDRENLVGLDEKFSQFIEQSAAAHEGARELERKRQAELKRERDLALAAEKDAKKYQRLSVVIGAVLVFTASFIGWREYQVQSKKTEEITEEAQEQTKLAEERKSIIIASADTSSIDGTSNTGLQYAKDESVQNYLVDTVAREVIDIKSKTEELVTALPGSFNLYSEEVVLEKSEIKPQTVFSAGTSVYFYSRLVAKGKTNVVMYYLKDGEDPDSTDPVTDAPIAPNPLGYRFFGWGTVHQPGDYSAVIFEWRETDEGYDRTEVQRINFTVTESKK